MTRDISCFHNKHFKLFIKKNEGTKAAGADLEGWIACCLDIPLGEGKNKKKLKKIVKIVVTEIKANSRQVPHCNLYFEALAVFVVEKFSITFQFFDCKIFVFMPQLILRPQGTS